MKFNKAVNRTFLLRFFLVWLRYFTPKRHFTKNAHYSGVIRKKEIEKLSNVILKGHIIVPSADLNAVKDELSTHIALTRQEDGCLVFEVSQDPENINKFSVYEEFTNRESFSNHQDRVGKSKWGAVTVNVERHYEITDV